MTLIFKHLGIGPDAEVIFPAYTLKDLLGLIESLGACPVPADIDPETLNVTPETIERRITPHTRAILVLHAFGSPCPVEDIVRMADRHNLPVIEDCAHSLGATIHGKATGSFGKAAFFSLETSKPVNTFGGGMVVSPDAALIESIRAATADDPVDATPVRSKAKAVRMERILFSTGLCFPFLYLLACPRLKGLAERMYRSMQHAPPDVQYLPIQAELGLDKLATLDERIETRRRHAEMYRSLLAPDIRTQHVPEGCTSTGYLYVAVLPRPAAPIRKKLLWHGIDAVVEDEITDNCAAVLADDACPVTQEIYPRAIALPMYEGLSEQAIRKVARLVNRAAT